DEGRRLAFPATTHRANRVPSASLVLILRHDVSTKSVNVNAPLPKNVNSMMSIQYSSIRPGFQTTLQSRQ
ncbi:MAG: hypothetical protein WBQ85_15240, partial [Candidatus Sulfotelmatobacter sp.]